MQIREKKIAAGPIISLTLGNGLTIPNPTDGKIFVEIDSIQTSTFNFKCAVYDIEIFVLGSNPPIVERMLEGSVDLNREVTR